MSNDPNGDGAVTGTGVGAAAPVDERPGSRGSGLDRFDAEFLGEPEPALVERPSSFEERALRQGGNPLEHMDQLFRQTSRRTWLGVMAVGALLASAVVWSMIAHRVVTVDVQAFMLPRGGVYSVGELISGGVRAVAAGEGDAVTAGQRLATVDATGGATIDIVSPIDGVILSAEVRAGEFKAAGSPFFIVAPNGIPVAIGLVPAGAVNAIAVGQDARIAVNGISSDRYGQIRGRVAFLGDVPLSAGRLKQLTGSSASASSLGAKGPLYEVVVELTSAETPSGLRWTQGRGPATAVRLGALALTSVTVDRQPLIKKAFR